MDDMDTARLLTVLLPEQRDQLLLDALRRDAELLEQARDAVAATTAGFRDRNSPRTSNSVVQPTAISSAAVDFADLPAPVLELVAGCVYASFCRLGSSVPPVSEVLSAARALRGTCQAWRRNISTARTVVALDLGPRMRGKLWWDPTYGATVRSVQVQPVPPRVFPTAGPATGMPRGTAPDALQDEMQLECRVVRHDGSGQVRLEVCGSRRAQETPDRVYPQVELCDTGGGGGTVWVRGGVDLSRGEIPWHSCVPYPWPDVTNANPRPIYTIPLPPPDQFNASFALLAHVSLAGLLLGKLPIALRSLPSLKVLDLRFNLLRDLPTWLPQLERLTMLDLTDSGLPASFIMSDQAMNGRDGVGLLPLSLTDLRMGCLRGHDPFHDPYEKMTTLPRWLGATTVSTLCSSLERLDLSDNQLDLRQVALPWHSQQLQPGHRRGVNPSSGSLCPWFSLRYLSLRNVRTNTVPHFLCDLHLIELDLNGLDVHDRGGGAIALPPEDAAPVRGGDDVDDAVLAYLQAAAARDDAILGFMAHPTIADALSGMGGSSEGSNLTAVAPPTLCTLLNSILRPPLSLSLVRIDAAIMLDDAEAIEEEVVGSMGEPDQSVLSVLRQLFVEASPACPGGACPQLKWVRFSQWHSLAMDELTSQPATRATTNDDSMADEGVWIETARETRSGSQGVKGHRDYSRTLASSSS